MSEKSENRFKDNIASVQHNADGKGVIETRRGMRVAGVRVLVMVRHVDVDFIARDPLKHLLDVRPLVPVEPIARPRKLMPAQLSRRRGNRARE